MTHPEKPDADNDNLEPLVVEAAPNTPPAEPVLGTEGLVRIGLAVLIFVLACAAMVYFWNT